MPAAVRSQFGHLLAAKKQSKLAVGARSHRNNTLDHVAEQIVLQGYLKSSVDTAETSRLAAAARREADHQRSQEDNEGGNSRSKSTKLSKLVGQPKQWNWESIEKVLNSTM